MTIECTACHARYTIADALVPPQGARVRCRKCGAVFQVKPSGPVVTPEALPVVPPSPEPSPPGNAPPTVREAPPEPSPELPTAVEPPPPPAPEPAHAPAPPPAAAPEPAPQGHPDPGFERFPAHAAPRQEHAPASEFERFPSGTAQAHGEIHAGPATYTEPEPLAAPAPAAPEPEPEPEPRVEAPPPPPAHEAAPAAHHASPSPAEPSLRPRISATTLPEGLSPEELQRHERARRLARVLASDIAIYNREKRERGIRDGNLVAVLGYEIKKSWETYKERVGTEFANSTPYFRDALNEIVAEGKKIF